MEMIWATTLNAIREHKPCADGWAKLLRHLGKATADDEPLPIVTVLDSNGLDDALWCLRAVDGHDREIRLYAIWCARKVQHLMTDPRSAAALDVAERFANGDATQEEADVAWVAARAAAQAARAAVFAAARAAVYAASGDAWAAADSAGAAAADEVGGDSRCPPAWLAGWSAARTEQEAKLREMVG